MNVAFIRIERPKVKSPGVGDYLIEKKKGKQTVGRRLNPHSNGGTLSQLEHTLYTHKQHESKVVALSPSLCAVWFNLKTKQKKPNNPYCWPTGKDTISDRQCF